MYPVRTINSIIDKLSQNEDDQNIILLDEIIPYKCERSTENAFDLTLLNTSKSNVHLLLAVNPSPMLGGFNKKITILPPINENTLAYQLHMKHRNALEIGIFLEHYKSFYERGCLDSSQDIPLDKTVLPAGRYPVWIQRSKNVSYESVLELIKSDHVLEHESVTLLYEYSIKPNILQWCSHNNWKCIKDLEFYGCEDQVIVTFDIGYLMPEQVSRAKNGLIILTTKG